MALFSTIKNRLNNTLYSTHQTLYSNNKHNCLIVGGFASKYFMDGYFDLDNTYYLDELMDDLLCGEK